jgi:hypothetical protein
VASKRRESLELGCLSVADQLGVRSDARNQ